MGFIFKFFYALLLFLLDKCLSLATIREGAKCIENERKALLSIKQGIVLDDSGMLSTWRDDGDHYEDCYKWKGICCSNETGQIQSLNLRGSYPVNLFGEINITLLSELHDMEYLDLSHNEFYRSEIPRSIESFTKLRYLNLSASSFVGTIPHQLGKLSKLQHLDLGQNLLIGVIPFQLGNLSMLQTLHLGSNSNLSSNSLTGEIPKEVASLLGLVSLNLSRNKLIGKIPTMIGNLGSLEFLDLSRNRLSGPIPLSLAYINRLSVLDLSSNRLSGKIPTGTQLQSFNGTSYEGNLDLCGLPLKKCPGDETPTPQHIDHFEDGDSYLTGEFYLSLGLGFAFGFWAFTGPLLFNRSWRQTYYTFFRRVTDRVHILMAVYVARYITNR